MLVLLQLLFVIALPLAVFVLLGAILTAVKTGFSEVVNGLQAIHDKLDERD